MAGQGADRLVGEDRCWPCTVSNALVGVIVAGIPLLGGLTQDDPVVLLLTVVWAAAVLGYTLYRLVSRGYLPGSETVAKRSGLHERIGPGAEERETDADPRRDGPQE